MSQLHALRMIVATAAAVALVVSVAPRAEAHHRPNTYCSETGDTCQSVRKVDGIRRARITLAARYFGRYQLCVGTPFGYDACAEFRIRERPTGTYGGSVRLSRHFPVKHKGSYTVAWFQVSRDGDPNTPRIGRRLGFHVR